MTSPTDTEAPHGRGPDGEPLVPYGLNVNGSVRKTPGGRRAKGAGVRAPRASKGQPTVSGSSLTDVQRKGMLTELADMFLVTPLASLSQVPALKSRLGEAQTDALAGDALIVSHFMPMLADGAILLSKTKPGALSWLDKAEENAPYLVLANAALQMVKAIADNHMRPNANMAAAGRELAQMRMAQVADAVRQQAAAYARDMTPTEAEG